METLSSGSTYTRLPLSASSSQNLAQFDSKLDRLLEDLQSTVTGPRSTNSLKRRVHSPKSDYCSDDSYSYTSPDGNQHYRKDVSYNRSTATSDGYRTKSSLNELDSILDDLQPNHSKFTDYKANNNTSRFGLNPDLKYLDDQRITSSKSVLHYTDMTPRSSSCSRLERSGHMEQFSSSEGTYGDLRKRSHSPGATITKQTKVTNLQTRPIEVIQTIAPDINPEVLAHLDPELHPQNNTKVTTTIKTYTYEIPGSNLDTSIDTTPSKSFVYTKGESKKMDGYSSYRSVSPGVSSTKGGILKESVTTRSYQPETYICERTTTPTNQTYIYNETVTSRNLDGIRPCERKPTSREETYVVEEFHDATYPPPRPTTTLNYAHYNYKSEMATKTSQPEVTFPGRTTPISSPDGPPKKLDELMASIGTEPANSRFNAGYTAHEFEMEQQKRIVHQDDSCQRKETVSKTKNVVGPPVYYPPGELFTKKEEGAAWQAEGAYGQESGEYHYESESKSKSKKKSGATVVPVCLPLCCGLPCTIV